MLQLGSDRVGVMQPERYKIDPALHHLAGPDARAG